MVHQKSNLRKGADRLWIVLSAAWLVYVLLWIPFEHYSMERTNLVNQLVDLELLQKREPPTSIDKNDLQRRIEEKRSEIGKLRFTPIIDDWWIVGIFAFAPVILLYPALMLIAFLVKWIVAGFQGT